jgi:carboxylesterase
VELKTLEIPPGTEVLEDGKPFFFDGDHRIGCLLIHGFTGTTSSMKPMGESLAAKGVTVLGPRLPGHGTDVQDMARWSYTDWTSTVETALEELGSLCAKVFVAGLSMGGTLTLYLGENYQDRVSGIIPISAAVSRLAPSFAENQALKIVSILKHVLKTFPGPGNDLKDPSVTEVAYEKLSTEALHEFVKLADRVKADLGEITIPVRIFHSREDHVIPTENAVYVFDNVSSSDKELTWLDNSYHVATLDYDKELIFSESYDFMTRISAG